MNLRKGLVLDPNMLLRAVFGIRVRQISNGSPVRLNNILRLVLHPILKKLGIPKSGMHAFRRHRCSFWVEHDVPVAAIKQWLGDGSEQTIRRYTHHRPEYHSAILAKFPTAPTTMLGISFLSCEMTSLDQISR